MDHLLPTTWADAAALWLRETVHKRSHKDDEQRLRWISQYWSDIPIEDVSRQKIRALAECKASQAKLSTVNRYLALIRSILRRAVKEWECLDHAPFVRLYPEPTRRIRWITPSQARRLITELPEHLRLPVLFTLATGLRHGNVTQLRWSQIDLDRRTAWVYADQSKNDDDIHVSLNDTAMQVLYACSANRQGDFVFLYRGRPIKRFSTAAWYRALKRAGIRDFRWHDLRHTWASWLAQKGVPLYALQEMGGWKSAAMVRRYAHLSPATNLEHAKQIDKDLGGMYPD